MEKEFDIEAKKDELTPVVKEHMGLIHEKSQKVLNENGLSTMTVCCVTDLLDKGAYLGGVTMSCTGTRRNRFEMLYQLVKACYSELIKDTNEGYAKMLWNSFSKQVVNRVENFSFGMDEFAAELLRVLSDKDKESEDSDENRE